MYLAEPLEKRGVGRFPKSIGSATTRMDSGLPQVKWEYRTIVWTLEIPQNLDPPPRWGVFRSVEMWCRRIGSTLSCFFLLHAGISKPSDFELFNRQVMLHALCSSHPRAEFIMRNRSRLLSLLSRVLLTCFMGSSVESLPSRSFLERLNGTWRRSDMSILFLKKIFITTEATEFKLYHTQ